MAGAPAPIVISRRARTPRGRWEDAESWFGGRPRLGAVPWPRARSGKPLPFAAQIDLAEIAAVEPASPLPHAGSLAFFLEKGAVVHVPASADTEPTHPPADAMPVLEGEGDLFPQKPSPWARIDFPFWPVEATALDIGHVEPDTEAEDAEENTRDAMRRAVASRFHTRRYFLTAKAAYEALGSGAAPFWWHGAQLYAKQLRIARFHAGDVAVARQPWLERARAEVERLRPTRRFGLFGRGAAVADPALEKALKELEAREEQERDFRRQSSDIGRFIEEVERFAAGREPWTPMRPGEREAFAALFKRGRTEFADIVRYRTSLNIDALATETLLAMMTGGERAFCAMPEPVRDLLNRHYRLPTGNWHQMFGVGVDIQGNAASENDGNVLLLQLVYDDMIGWRFGDMGAFQFWMSPADLAARNWNGVRLTFECH